MVQIKPPSPDVMAFLGCNEYEAIYNVQNRIYKGKLNIAGDKYAIALKGPGGLVSGNGILNKTFTRAQGRDHMGCLFDATKR